MNDARNRSARGSRADPRIASLKANGPNTEHSARTTWTWSVGIFLLGVLAIVYFRGAEKPTPVEVVRAIMTASQPTVDIPSENTTATAEQLRPELLQLGTELMSRFPKVPEALHVVALLHSELQNTAEAERIWRECIPLAPHQPGPYVGLARVVMDLGRDDEAVEILKNAQAAGCSTTDLYNELANAFTKTGMLEEADQAVQQGLQAFPKSVDLWVQSGQIQNQLGKFPEAEKSLRRAIELGATSETVYFALANACARQGKQEEAARFRQEFADRKQTRVADSDEGFQKRYDVEMRRIAASSIYRAATVYDDQGDSQQSEKLLRRAIQLAPKNASIYSDLARLYRQTGRFADALVIQKRVVELDPQEIMHHLNLASLSQQLGDNVAAEKDLQRVVQIQPDLSIGYASLARFYLQRGDSRRARTFAEEALQRRTGGPDDVVATYLVLATACQQMGDATAMENVLKKARQLAPQDPRLR